MEYRLKVGESARINHSIFSSHLVIYAGMPNQDTYSLAITHSEGARHGGYNLFMPKDRREVFHKKGKIVVLDVNANEIRLKIEH
ncbi:MAG: hypothetical protein OEV49_15270 [candidate division Zixibacteria bacterium]|nr:hypothetical protein [candidate division Zixibacteria bacterium]MDH3936458.1 hypothetical protein [candidate division Zixibacteria bacterium]MDH4033103.1 hypothetical protein [candidate division Zixibacteria bacterium]